MTRCWVGITTIVGPSQAIELISGVKFVSGATVINPLPNTLIFSKASETWCRVRGIYRDDGTWLISVAGAAVEINDLIRPAQRFVAQLARLTISLVTPRPNTLITLFILLISRPALGAPISITQPATFRPCSGTRTRTPTHTPTNTHINTDKQTQTHTHTRHAR